MLDPLSTLSNRLHADRLKKCPHCEEIFKRRNTLPHCYQIGRVVMQWTIRTGLQWMGLLRRAYQEFLDVQVIENTIILPNLPRAFDGFRILQLSDLHADLDASLMDRVIALVDHISFDRCVLTGDYHNEIGNSWEESLPLMLHLLPHLAPNPLAILGNHDFIAKVIPFETAGLRVLLNESVSIERNGARIWICGVDDAHSFRTQDLHAASFGIPVGECRILLSHSPEVWREAACLGYDLQLSGHTHGGQLCLPGGHAIIRKAPVSTTLLAGPWREGNLVGYTSRGTGSCSIAARLNCPPEITIHTLKCS